jgi:hypothetical protein
MPLKTELDSGLAGDPAKLQERIRQLYSLVRTSLVEELNGGNGHSGNGESPHPPPSNGNGAHHSNGLASQQPRAATQSQVKAIFAIARSQRRDLGTFLYERFQVRKPEELSLKEASNLIDEMKSAQVGG